MSLGRKIQVALGQDWVLGQYEDYMAHRDLVKEHEVLSDLTSRPGGGERDRRGTWSPSAAKSCMRSQQFTYLGRPQRLPDDKAKNIFANGEYVHLRHQTFGIVAGYIQAAEVQVRLDTYNMVGTMDGLLSNGAGLEIKSINSFGYSEIATFGPKLHHLYQVNSYMLAAKLDFFHIVYENKDTNMMKEFMVERDDRIINDILDYLDIMNNATQEKRLLPMLRECRNLTGRYQWCPYAPICESATWEA